MKVNKLLALLLALCLVLATFISCGGDTAGGEGGGEQNGGETGGDGTQGGGTATVDPIDYVAGLKLDMNSASAKEEVTVKQYIDGDTTHFYLKSGTIDGSDIVKARYLAVNTPESTGKVEPWGKAASNFTKEKLKSAVSIMIESDDSEWNTDSNGRHLLWIWYKPAEDAEYRNLNLELLQNGLAIASNSAMNRYGDTCMSAIAQAKAQELYTYSDEKDPNFHYGAAIVLTLKELRTNVAAYEGAKVCFTGLVTYHYNSGCYIEEYDEITGLYYGMYLYYGNTFSGPGIEALAVGNEVRVTGVVNLFSGSWQVSSPTFDLTNPTNPDNIKILSKWNDPSYTLVEADNFVNGSLELPVGEEDVMTEFKVCELIAGTTITMEGLKVNRISTTTNDESKNKGALTIYCTADGVSITIRTIVLHDENGELVTADEYEGKTLNVRGAITYYDYNDLDDEPGTYQIQVLQYSDIEIVE
jgi:endonuclease YncB( thermonuclease family)